MPVWRKGGEEREGGEVKQGRGEEGGRGKREGDCHHIVKSKVLGTNSPS